MIAILGQTTRMKQNRCKSMTQTNGTPIFNLKAVVQETGLKPDTLRAWERRYGLPEPQRTASGHRLYTQRDIAILKWLIDRQVEGLSISRAVALWHELTSERPGAPAWRRLPAGKRAGPRYAHLGRTSHRRPLIPLAPNPVVVPIKPVWVGARDRKAPRHDVRAVQVAAADGNAERGIGRLTVALRLLPDGRILRG